jgi:hypothetical protein
MGTGVTVDSYPVYISPGNGVGPSAWVGGRVNTTEAAAATGLRSFSSLLEVQLVHAEGKSSARTGVRFGDYGAIGVPVMIVLSPADRFFLRQLPREYPMEVVDDHAAQQVLDGLVFSHCQVRFDRNRGCICEIEINVPELSPQLPLALRVDLLYLGKIAIGAWVASLIIDEKSTARLEDGAGVKSAGGSLSVESKGYKYKIRFLIPDISPSQLPVEPSSAQIRICSSRDIALRSDTLEHFLSVPEMRKVAPITIDGARNP